MNRTVLASAPSALHSAVGPAAARPSRPPAFRRCATRTPQPRPSGRFAARLRVALGVRVALALAGLLAAGAAGAQRVGEVDTVFRLIGPDNKVVVDAYDDPGVEGVACYVSRATTGGVKGAVGIAEDKADASIACRQVGALRFKAPLPVQEEIFSTRQSILFKRLHVVRMVDRARNTLVYLSYSDRLIEGSPKNSVTAVPVDAATPIPLRGK